MIRINDNLEKYFCRNVPIIFLHAHPDDESFLSAGMIKRLSMNNDVHIIYCAASLVTNEDRAIIRQKEAKKACELLGIKAIKYLNYCEPKYTSEDANPFNIQNPKDVATAILKMLEDLNVREKLILVSYDENGGYGNKDHVILNKAGRILKEILEDKVVLYEVSINRDAMLRWLSEAKNRLSENELPQLSYWSDNFGLKESELDFYYELSNEELDIKKQSLLKHKSQIKKELFPISLNDNDFENVFGKEWFKIIS